MVFKQKHRRRSEKAGLPPGTLIHVGEKREGEVGLHLIHYGTDVLEEKSLSNFTEYENKEIKTEGIEWLDVVGLHDTALIEQIGKKFSIHPLALEDILNTEQRPKIDEYDDFLYIVLKMLDLDEETGALTIEQVSFILKENLVISFQERKGDVFDSVRERIRNTAGRFRKLGADYLLYALMDSVVDNYFVILEKIGEQVEETEELLLTHPDQETVRSIYRMKRELLTLRHAVWPLREAVSSIRKTEHILVQSQTQTYFSDLYDHVIQNIDTVENFRETVSGMLDLYLSSISNRMNEVMRVLTVIATLFIPLTFIVGVYGMNFKYMPELEWHWGYPFVWILMACIALVMMYWFKRKKWL
ncbi:MAG: magnesium/cobalt transporter CorA [Aminobacterium sp.]|jgi:magnesium transporter|uniref:magnesium/cobalt transporter CorA n=1 Tax=unclassified Aminobacterium TaxID=2685012 RepID=UPI001BCECA87|nr:MULTISPECIES: magnesium/cobalt transporter CorA [unclassified Aminobacterium]MDD2206821.1 magnesium/cobalt transporter CorA [Aminobacterium sp.]MDD3708344.1 magnesium/cobalt transporter CorA [Aminobacterium sp.]MDD4228533.1 magnesium/cobalt transporter CorA [Aminobacterium sp.]MDD4551491.1 magnesium/cobalt transporter CorA [Aminobacterium sp.]MEA4876658.1 magnesium/cobalt transporter CorA [Aminobacterium sp.]